jgi:hypothetical protein
MKKASFLVSLSLFIVSLSLCLLGEVSLAPRSVWGQSTADSLAGADFPPFLYTSRRDIGRDPAPGLVKLREWLSRTAFTKSNREARLKARAAGENPSRMRVNATPAQLETQWDLAGKAGVKIMISDDGWYRITQPELVAAGLDPGVNPKRLQLFLEGEEQAILVTGTKDRRFNPKDVIEFYGTGMDTPHTDTRVYWLAEGNQPGKRIKTLQGSGGTPSPATFPFTVKQKERSYFAGWLNNGEAENFFGSVVSYVPVGQVLNVTNPVLSSSLMATLEVALQGATDGQHRVKVSLNGAEVGEMAFQGQDRGVASFSVSQAGLVESPNIVTLTIPGPVDEVNPDISLVDYVQLTYGHAFTADSNSLKLEAQGGQRVIVRGFTKSGIRVFDITDPQSPLRLQATVRSLDTGYSITFRAPGSGTRTLLAFAGDTVRSPKAMVRNEPSTWHERQTGYDFVIITHADFLESLRPLKQLRESQGLSVAIVNVEDLYDEFNFGAKSPYAIKDFLQRTTSEWQSPPRFVLLVGDASFDPKDYLGYGDFDFLPTKFVETLILETASDDWFVDFNGDGLPEMAVGRLAARTADQVTAVVSKLIAYEQSDTLNKALFVSDILDEEFNFDYHTASLGVAELLPSSLPFQDLYRGGYQTQPEAKLAVLAGINEGPLLVNYIGNGAVESWQNQILYTYDAPSLTNGSRLPFFVHMAPFTGLFPDLFTEGLAEALLKAPDGGALAVWASSGSTEPPGQVVMNEELIRLLFSVEDLTLGEAVARAKSAVTDQDIRRTWIFFGDPTTKLKR